jgi:hypothetical protein
LTLSGGITGGRWREALWWGAGAARARTVGGALVKINHTLDHSVVAERGPLVAGGQANPLSLARGGGRRGGLRQRTLKPGSKARHVIQGAGETVHNVVQRDGGAQSP